MHLSHCKACVSSPMTLPHPPHPGMLLVKGDLPVALWSGAPVDGCEAILLAAHFFGMDLAWTDCFFGLTMLVYSDDQE